MHNYFHRLHNLPPLPRLYSKLAISADYQWPDEHKKPNQITLSFCPEFERTQFVQQLKQDFGKIVVMLFRNEPHSFYDWHCDLGEPEYGPRSCCINYPLTVNEGALTLFKDHSYNELNHSVAFCDYEFLQPTLFNTQVPHAVLNPSSSPRYILSVSFFGKKFEDIRENLSAINISKYN
jgi:hypothetical protein